MKRLPNTLSPEEVRRAFQKRDEQISTLEGDAISTVSLPLTFSSNTLGMGYNSGDFTTASSQLNLSHVGANTTASGVIIGQNVDAEGRVTAVTVEALTTDTEDYLAGDGNFVKLPDSLAWACSDETTALTTGTAKASIHSPVDMTATAVYAGVSTPPTGSSLIVDLNKNGSSILSERLFIEAGEYWSGNATTQAAISVAAISVGDLFSADIDQVGSTTSGAGLKIYVTGTRV